MSDVYENRPLSKLVIDLMNYGGVKRKCLADELGISKKYFDNKLARDSFSFTDILKISYMCGFVMNFESVDKTITIGQDRFDSLNSINERHKREYRTLKERLKKLENVYGFNKEDSEDE